jgi:hypothetical protein
MAEGSNGTNWFSAKDAMVAIPITASVLALCWEVGSFVPIRGAAFSYFSIPEHLAFAVPALPVALMFATALFFSEIAARQIFDRLVYGRWSPGPSEITKIDNSVRQNLSRLSIWIMVICFATFVGVLEVAKLFKSATIGAMALSSLLAGSTQIARARTSRFPLILLGAGISVLFLAFALGVDSTRALLNNADIETIDTVDGQMTAVVVKSGERGVLLYDRSRGSFAFRKWDSIKRTEWLRKPLLPLWP